MNDAARSARSLARSVPMWLLAPCLLLIETAVCSVAAAALLDLFVRRPLVGGGSVTTLLPGFVYACATVMKVCLVASLAWALGGTLWRLFRGFSVESPSRSPAAWAIASVAIGPFTLIIGTFAVLLSDGPRAGVFAMLALLAGGAGAAVISLLRREQAMPVAALGLAVNIVLIALFCYFRFYAPGFDQDAWAPR